MVMYQMITARNTASLYLTKRIQVDFISLHCHNSFVETPSWNTEIKCGYTDKRFSERKQKDLGCERLHNNGNLTCQWYQNSRTSIGNTTMPILKPPIGNPHIRDYQRRLREFPPSNPANDTFRPTYELRNPLRNDNEKGYLFCGKKGHWITRCLQCKSLAVNRILVKIKENNGFTICLKALDGRGPMKKTLWLLPWQYSTTHITPYHSML